jgi:hypothetical protein
MSDQERCRRRLTYIGKRIATSGGLIGFWIDEDGNEYGYRKLAPEAAPGGRYDVTLSACGRRRNSLARRCRYSPPGSWDECLLDRSSLLRGPWTEQVVERSGESVG